MSDSEFYTAKSIWPDRQQHECNLFVGFRAVVEGPVDGPVVVRIAAATIYRVSVNGKFIGHGPARAAHGYCRVDQWVLPDGLTAGANVVAIEVAGYNVNCYYVVKQPSFLRAEIVAGGRVFASTAGDGRQFEAAILSHRVQKTQRYSAQRTFSECYRLTPDHDRWRHEPDATFVVATCSVQPDLKLLPRRVPYPDFDIIPAGRHLRQGGIRKTGPPATLWMDRSLTRVGPTFAGFAENQLELIPSIELQYFENVSPQAAIDKPDADTGFTLKANEYHVLDFATNLTGFIGAIVHCRKLVRLFFTFDELLTDGDVDFKRLKCVNIVSYELAPGTYRLESFEPYTLRYLKLIALAGECRVEQVFLRDLANPDVYGAEFSCPDDELIRVFEAARQTFRQNAVDLFMDCPSRERAGWLCDSFFTARVAHDLSHDTTIERNMYENYLLPGTFADLPKGMLPKCYPADTGGGFHPTWAMWFVVQLNEYLERSGDRAMIDALHPRVLGLLEYFEKFRNHDNLLENLDGAIFIEWSQANQFVQDVSYPANMLYARVLEIVARLYDAPGLAGQADQIRNVIRDQSFDGEFFVDNAVRDSNSLKPTRNRTEVCQYFAFFFDVADEQTHPQLWQALRDQFGPKRKRTGDFSDVHAANAFVGNYLRIELLSRHGLCRQILDELKQYFLHMADLTGTLWEHDNQSASCNHGFASHAAHVIYRDVLGIYEIDTLAKKVMLRFADLPLESCRGRIPTDDGYVYVEWRRENGALIYNADAPIGYTLHVNALGVEARPG